VTLIDIGRAKFKPELDYMTKSEMGIFKKLREEGRISFFKCGNCCVCGAEIIKSKKYCSQTCKEKEEASNATVDMGH